MYMLEKEKRTTHKTAEPSLKMKFATMNYNTTDLHAVIAGVIFPEVVAHLVAHDLEMGAR
jgi:hypothetical protein